MEYSQHQGHAPRPLIHFLNFVFQSIICCLKVCTQRGGWRYIKKNRENGKTKFFLPPRGDFPHLYDVTVLSARTSARKSDQFWEKMWRHLSHFPANFSCTVMFWSRAKGLLKWHLDLEMGMLCLYTLVQWFGVVFYLGHLCDHWGPRLRKVILLLVMRHVWNYVVLCRLLLGLWLQEFTRFYLEKVLCSVDFSTKLHSLKVIGDLLFGWS